MLTEVQPSRVVATDCSSGHVLVVDDDPAVRHLISGFFGQHGIRTVSAMGRSAVARQLAGGDTSAVILDPHLSQDNGLDLLREIRSSSDVLAIILTGRSRDEVDCVVGLELGADDYLTKPFGIRELYARFRAVRMDGPCAGATSSGADTSSADGGLIVAAGASSIRGNGRLP
jgi:two-component system OmpR family response regulator